MKDTGIQHKPKGNVGIVSAGGNDKPKEKPKVHQKQGKPQGAKNEKPASGATNAPVARSTPRVTGDANKMVKKVAPRAFNNRQGGVKKGGKSTDGALFTAMGGERGKSRRNREENDEDKKASWDKIPDAIQPLLFDHEFFAKKASEANRIIDSKMDPLDSFLAEAFMGSFKTSDNTYQTFIESDKGKGLQLPQPRSMSQLQHAMLPRILAPTDTTAYSLAEAAWKVRLGKQVFS
jgi:hypothetical protein